MVDEEAEEEEKKQSKKRLMRTSEIEANFKAPVTPKKHVSLINASMSSTLILILNWDPPARL